MVERPLRPSTRQAVLDAAIDTLARNPGASLSEIATRAGVGRASLHRHFPSRADLIAAASQQCMDEIDAATAEALKDAQTARERLSRMLEAVVPLGDRYHFLVSEAADDESVRMRYQEDLDWIARLVDDLKREGVIAAEVPHNWAVVNIDAQIWIAWSEVAAGNLAPAHAADLAIRTLLEGLGS
ncbi:MAG: helix-turn-helix domain containing protein [Rhodospirillaceae bacterium]|nr:helix-turn-helix domain containing protein [Rhodospirillaceae bacterium]